MCCSPWGRKESDTIEQLTNDNKNPEGDSFLSGAITDFTGTEIR